MARPAPPSAPEPPRRRRAGLRWTLAVLLVLAVVAAAVLGGVWWARRGTALVWVTTADVPAGGALAGQVRPARVQHPVEGALPGGAALPAGVVAREPLPAGSTVTAATATTGCALVPSGSVLAGLPVPAGRGPAEGLRPGDLVAVLAAPDSRAQADPKQPPAARPVVASAPVVAVAAAGDGGQIVTVRVGPEQGSALAAPAAAGQLVLLRLPGHAEGPC
ncbi:MAG TPA: hypothetical protein VFS29_02800 [Motilibacteraceae bacterium]|nr:hypothetical protein [Motilibacteraceae bacterium]